MTAIRTVHQRKVLEFNNLVGAPHPSTPTVPSPDMCVTRARLVMEEALELIEAMGVIVSSSTVETDELHPQLTMEHLRFFFNPKYPVDLAEVAKEAADVHVVTTGTEHVFGIDLHPIQDAVDDNNLAKFGPGSYVDDKGKLRKPPGHPKPDVAKLLREQGWQPNKQEV